MTMAISSIRSTHVAASVDHVAKYQAAIAELLEIDGVIEAAIADLRSGMALALDGQSPRESIELAIAANSEVLLAKMRAMQMLQIKSAIRDVSITLDDRVYVLRPLRCDPLLFAYVAADREKCNFALTRMRVCNIADAFEL